MERMHLGNKNGNNNQLVVAKEANASQLQDQANVNNIFWNDLPVIIISNILDNVPPRQRLRVSSTCKSWRNALYQSQIWPVKHLNINLCSYKLILSWQKSSSGLAGVHMFNFLSHHNRQAHEQDNRHLHHFLRKCSRFVESLTIFFDPNSRYNVNDVVKIVKHMSKDTVPVYQLDAYCSTRYSNCRRLKSLTLSPVTTQTRMNESFLDLYYELNEAFKDLIAKCCSLQHVSFGAMETLLTSPDDQLTCFIKGKHHKTLECLNLATIKSNVLHSKPIAQNSLFSLLPYFGAIRSLTIDFDWLDTKVVAALSSLELLDSLTINVHRDNHNHPGILKETWIGLHAHLPNLKATINLLHTNLDEAELLIESLIDTRLPIQTFAAYYIETSDNLKLLMGKLAQNSNRSLRRLVLVDHVNKPNQTFVDQSPNSLTMLAWRCKQLEEISIFGYIIDDMDLLAIVLLRGERLLQLNVPASCIKLTWQLCTDYLCYDYRNNFNDGWFYNTAPNSFRKWVRVRISKSLGRFWRPIFDYNIPAVMFNSTSFPQLTYHRTVLEQQQCSCKFNSPPPTLL